MRVQHPALPGRRKGGVLRSECRARAALAGVGGEAPWVGGEVARSAARARFIRPSGARLRHDARAANHPADGGCRSVLSDRRRPRADLPLLLGHRRSPDPAGAGPLAHEIVFERGRRGVRLDRLSHRGRAGLGHPRGGPAPRPRNPAVHGKSPSRAGAAGGDRAQGVLLPLPRHEDRRALRDRRAVEHRHRPVPRRRPLLPVVLRRRSPPREGNPGDRRPPLPAGGLEFLPGPAAPGLPRLVARKRIQYLGLARV